MKFQEKGKYSCQYPLQAYMMLKQLPVDAKVWQFTTNIFVGFQKRVE